MVPQEKRERAVQFVGFGESKIEIEREKRRNEREFDEIVIKR